MTTATANGPRAQLLRDGFCHFPQILDDDLLERTRRASDQLLDALPQEQENAKYKFQNPKLVVI